MSNLPNRCSPSGCGNGCRSISSGCAVCGNSDKLLRCSKCRNILYCSRDHQRLDWERHRKPCKKQAALLKEVQKNLEQSVANENHSQEKPTGERLLKNFFQNM